MGGLVRANLFLKLKTKPLDVSLPGLYLNELQGTTAQDSLRVYKQALLDEGQAALVQSIQDLFAGIQLRSHLLEQWVQARMSWQDAVGKKESLMQQARCSVSFVSLACIVHISHLPSPCSSVWCLWAAAS
jgi:hypothetical protein